MLKIRDLNKKYYIEGREVTALENINLDIAAGTFVTVIGKSGCGKSTLLRVISGLEEATSGELKLQEEIKTALVFQEARLMPWLTVEENIHFPLKNKIPFNIASKKVKKQLELLSLTEFKDAYPEQISGGMAQRTALGRALVFDSDLILMDEPLGSLDAFNRDNLQQDLKKIFAEKKNTVIFVTHDIDEALLLGERLLIMDSAKIIKEFELNKKLKSQENPEYYQLKNKILDIIKKES